MALLINGISGKYILPNILSRKYKYAAFTGPVLQYQQTLPNGKTQVKSLNIKNTLNQAWLFVTKRAAVHKPCNDYFRTLSRKKSLKDIITEGNIIIHCLIPKGNYTFTDLPDANTAGRDIGLDPYLIIAGGMGLASTLIHELAHVAGASTNPVPNNPKSIAAETALLHCLCRKQFRKNALGSIQVLRPGDSRVV
jgi:hypothetical protein